MSDIEKLIEQWRSSLAGSDTLSPADVEELENHLREEVSHLKALSLSNEEAFLVARHRLGDLTALEREFAKVRSYRGLIHRLCWAMMGVLLYLAATEFAGMMFPLSLKLGYLAGLQQTTVGLLGSAVELMGFAGLLLLALWLYVRHLHHRIGGQVKHSQTVPIVAAATLTLATWVFFVTGRLLTVILVRTVGTPRFGAALHASGYVREAGHLLVPALCAGLLIILYLRSRREVRAT